jgi:hypothetical protein
MKVANKSASTLIEGEVESVKMSVSEKGMDKMCRFLRDDIYTHKEWAVVREILANAVDEHSKHGVTRPIEVTLPSIADAHFRVRDFALGLSKEKVFSVFFQYFESTKDQDNDNIGGFGIGAKSPLAYADMFFVDSYHNGEKTSYASNINGEASVAHKMGLTDTSETGIEVAVPVSSGDFEKFAKLVGEFIHFGDYQEVIKVSNEELLQTPESKWQIENELGKTGHSKTMFKGQSYRPIFGSIKGILYKLPETTEVENPFFNDLILFLNPEDDWDIHPSRERLQLSKRNIHLLNEAVEKFVDHSISETKAMLSKATTAREKFKLNFDISAFRNKSQLSEQIEAPKLLGVEAKNVEFISWNQQGFNRYDCRKMQPSNSWKTWFEFTPSGIREGLHSDNHKSNLYEDKGSILFVEGGVIRTDQVITYCEKNGIQSPVFVLRMNDENEIPSGWVEDSDHHVLSAGDVSKEEIATIRKRFNPQGKATRSASVGISASDVIGYKNSYRSNYNRIRMQNIDEKKKIAIVPVVESRIMASSVPSCFHYLRNTLEKTHNIVFAFQTHIKRLDKAKVQYDLVNKSLLESLAQDYVNQHQVVEPMKVRGHSHEFDGYKVGSLVSAEANVVESIKEDYPNMKATKENPVIGKLRQAEKRFQALTELEQEMVTTLESWQGRAYPVIRKHAKQILKDKVFI